MSSLSPFQSLCQFIRPQAFSAATAELGLVARICEQSDSLRQLPDRGLAAHADKARAALAGQAQPASSAALVSSFAALREGARRVLGVEFYEVQLLAGLALSRGSIAEMQTGEGKTFSAALPAFFNVLSGRKVHVASPNAYLAARDCELLTPLFRMFSISAGLLRERVPSVEKRAAYACDVTYGTGYEFGFDYLRDQLAIMAQRDTSLGKRHRKLLGGQSDAGPQLLQAGHAAAVIDEIDSVLIDEACMPLILSEPNPRARDKGAYLAALETAAALGEGVDYTVDAAARSVQLTEQGQRRIYERDVSGLEIERPWSVYVQQALHARLVLKKDVDYVVVEEKVQLVDPFTGRIFADRSWRDGLHQAVEAKESLPIADAQQTTARISRQRYFKLYSSISGMTGTAQGCESEFWDLYRLPIIVIPPRLGSRREVLPSQYYGDAPSKWAAVTAEVQLLHRVGRPVLIGSRTIENSQRLAQCFAAAGLPFQLLNGRQDEEEAEIIGQAGRQGAVTIATNMAGRGTDIKLGAGVRELGGLHVIGLEYNESPRIDRQLIGRAARQGDPGSARFFASGDDALVERFAPELSRRMKSLASPDGSLTEDFSKDFRALQRRAEADNYAQRRSLLSYHRWVDDVLAKLVKES